MREISRPKWYENLSEGPILECAPTYSQIQNIMDRSIRSKTVRRRSRYLIALTTAAVIALLTFSGMRLYRNELRNDIKQATIPGSAEWNNLQHAVEEFRKYPPGQVHIQYVLPVNDGVLIFYQRFFSDNSTDLTVEYMRKTFHDWKWIHGGGGGGSYSEDTNYLFGEYIPSPDTYLHTHTPFPLLYGMIVGEATNVVITDQYGLRIEATVFPSKGQLGWFAIVPESTGSELNIQSVDPDGRIIQEKTIDINDYVPGKSVSSVGSQQTNRATP
jgi:hypothetical protein